MGKRDLREVSSFLRLLLLHLMKIDASHDASSVAHWRSEAREFRRGAVRAFAPGMRELIDVSTLWREAAERFEEDGRDLKLPSRPLRECPFDLAAILSDAFDLDLALDLMEPVEAAAADGGRRLG